MYTIRILGSSEQFRIHAASHRDAARSVGAAVGAVIIVDSGRTVVRFKVDQRRRIIEQSSYTGEGSR